MPCCDCYKSLPLSGPHAHGKNRDTCLYIDKLVTAAGDNTQTRDPGSPGVLAGSGTNGPSASIVIVEEGDGHVFTGALMTSTRSHGTGAMCQ